MFDAGGRYAAVGGPSNRPKFKSVSQPTTEELDLLSAYVERLDRRVAEAGIAAPLMLMKSSGGVTSARTAKEFPVETALSGQAAGVIGATFAGASAGMHEDDQAGQFNMIWTRPKTK